MSARLWRKVKCTVTVIPELAVNRRPFAEVFVQIAPGNTRPRNPENPIQNKAMIPRATLVGQQF